MKNYRMYLPGFREMCNYFEEGSEYSLNTRLYLKSEYRESIDYIIPVKREKNKKRLFNSQKKSLKDSVIEKVMVIGTGSDVNSYLIAEYGGNLARDFYGRYIIPYSYFPDMSENTKIR